MLRELKQTVRSWLDGVYGDSYGVYPPSDSPEEKSLVASYVDGLFKDSKTWRDQSLQRRFRDVADPILFWKQCRDLEAGNHWETWGKRNQSPGNEWRHELQDNFIGNQTRVRKSYLTAALHDITIAPNLLNVNEIIQQERDQSFWYKNNMIGTHRMLVEGTEIRKSIFDRSEDPRGIADELVCDNESVFPSPFSTGFAKRENCWYVIHATVITEQGIRDAYPDFDLSSMDWISNERASEIANQKRDATFQSFMKTRFTDHLEVWMDDPTLVDAEFNQAEVEAEIQAIQDGVQVEPKRGQNHPKFIETYLNTIDNLENGLDVGTPEDQKFTQDVIDELVELMTQRRVLLQDEQEFEGVIPGKRKKYPFGRKIVVIGTAVQSDKPNPFVFDWRRLWHKSNCETLPGHFWGRGVAEILWNTNQAADTALSRLADLTVTVGMPKAYFGIEDKETVSDPANPYSNDPTKPGFFTSRPPVFPKGMLPPELLALYEIYKAKSAQEIGVNDVTFGEAPSKRASGAMVDTLIRQNTVLITGEAAANQNYMLEEIIETRIEMYKLLYREPRYYIINGQEVSVTLSREFKKLHTFQVRVKPNSNFPNQWEQEFDFAFQLATTPLADGMPAIPREALIDIIAKRYPEFGRSSKYYQISQALQLGMQEIERQKAQAAKDANTQQQIDQKITGVGISELTKQISGGGNGT